MCEQQKQLEKCPFCGVIPPLEVNGLVKHLYNGCILDGYFFQPDSWNTRAQPDGWDVQPIETVPRGEEVLAYNGKNWNRRTFAEEVSLQQTSCTHWTHRPPDPPKPKEKWEEVWERVVDDTAQSALLDGQCVTKYEFEAVWKLAEQHLKEGGE